jgi:hypothetical protein
MNPSILESRVEKLTGLLEVGKAMASERNLDRLLQLILGEVTKVMAADRTGSGMNCGPRSPKAWRCARSA